MKASALIAVLLLATGPALAEDTTSVHNGTNSATVTQSGSPADTRKTVEQSPGHIRIDQTNGSNSATVIQNGAGTLPDMDEDTDGKDMDGMGLDDEHDQAFGAPKDASPRKPDVFATIHREASPRSKEMLDRLMGEMKLRDR